MKKFTTGLFVLFIVSMSIAQSSAPNFWTDVKESDIEISNSANRGIVAEQFRTLSLDIESLKNVLTQAPLEDITTSFIGLPIMLPLPDGTMGIFEVAESSVMMPGLAVKFPEIKSYKGVGEQGTVRFDISPKGFHASFFTKKGEVYIDPYFEGASPYYTVYYTRDYLPTAPIQLSCGKMMEEAEEVNTPIINSNSANTVEMRNSEPVILRTYRLAMACTGEYGSQHGGTVAGAMAMINTTVNRLNGVFERDLAVRMLLVENNEEVIFLNGSEDFYTNGDLEEMIDENPPVLNNRIGINNYDVGHVLGTNNSINGLAQLQSVCGNASEKGRGGSTSFNTAADAFIISVVGHEMGHQMGAQHSFNSCQNVNQPTGYEPGGGTTIMSYAGICGNPLNNFQSNADDYYHVVSLQQIFAHTREGNGDTCPTKTETGNNEPKVTIAVSDGFYIPISTPFELTASATDENGDDLTYCWEQYNLGPENSVPGTPQGTSPLFRSWPPTENNTRVFPRMSNIINNTSSNDEVLPTYTRNLTFRCTVRDNNPAGGASVWEEVSFEATDAAGPFRVTHPNTQDDIWYVGDFTEVTWDVANTDNNLVNCQRVNITLSTDGGQTYPIILAANTFNDGSEFISVPNNETNTARVRVEAADNIFFDISNRNFRIMPPLEPGFALTITPVYQVVCVPTSVDIAINTESLLDFEGMVELEVVDGLPDGAEAIFDNSSITAGSSAILTVNLLNVDETSLVNISVQATSDTISLTRTFALDLVSTDFSAIQYENPANGATGVVGGPTLSWTPSPNADTYTVEIATSPAFGNTIVETGLNLTETSYPLTGTLDESTIYYWRVIAFNDDCGAKTLPPAAFQTVTAACAENSALDVPLALPSSVTIVENTIEVAESGTISDVKVPIVRGSYPGVNGLIFTLEGPDGTQVVLFDQNCGLTNTFNLGFNDDAPTAIECPPTSGVEHQPIGNLADFEGKNSQGTWKLIIDIRDPGFGGGGSLDEWTLEFCASLSPSAPMTVNNNEFCLPFGSRSDITSEFLLHEDEDNPDFELTYTLVTEPQNGTLYLNDTPISVEGTFKQSHINGGVVSYEHNNTPADTDSFVFTVSDTDGGWLGTPTFTIVIDENCVVGTDNLNRSNEVNVFPNPTDDVLNVIFQKPINGTIDAAVYNVQGQLMQRTIHQNIPQQLKLATATLASGIYFLNIQTAEGFYTKRFVVR